ncbi:hypothetical protein, partial [Nocardia brasiliensis]|uniref:hypothetical protein n=1 Tax=Nocardia brasiliensis TaxID=37326 RepID=UPI002457BB41
MPEVALPIVVNGETVADSGVEPLVVTYESGWRITIPRPTPALVGNVLKTRRDALAQLHLDEITVFLERVGRLWGDRGYPGRRAAVALAAQITGYHETMIEDDYTRVAGGRGGAPRERKKGGGPGRNQPGEVL